MRFSFSSLPILSSLLLLFIHSKKELPVWSLHKTNTITLQIELYDAKANDSVEIEYSPVKVIGFNRESKYYKTKITKGPVVWTLRDAEATYVSPKIFGQQEIYWLAEPGDNVTIRASSDRVTFNGVGAATFRLQFALAEMKRKLPKPSNPNSYPTQSLEDFWQWDHYLNTQTDTLLSLIDAYKDSISAFAYQHIRAEVIDKIEDDRHEKFTGLRAIAEEHGISRKDLCHIFDSAFNRDPARWMRSLDIGIGARGGHIKDVVLRKYGFDLSHSDLDSRDKRNKLYYEEGKKTYKGLTRELFLVELLAYDVIKKSGYTDETENILKDYYSNEGFDEHKRWMKTYEQSTRLLKAGRPAPDFSLVDSNGIAFIRSSFQGKICVLDFWFTGCKGCVQMSGELKQVEKAFEKDTNVVFVSICTDKDRSMWLKSVQQKKYTTGGGINLSTGTSGDDHPILKKFNITAFPSLAMLDPDGNILVNPVPDPRVDQGKKLIGLIREQLTLLHDGPYVFNNYDSSKVYLLNGNSISSKFLNRKQTNYIAVQTDLFQEKFKVQLNRSVDIEKSEFARPANLLVLSDIEGNFSALRKLLLSNGAIDSSYQWTFGKGDLVVVGDVFDRDKQVTECLWLLYSLEEKAKKAGGYVHFILGNHEIMNLSGDHDYTKEKYIKNAQVLGKTYQQLFGKDTELGQWLRTKNIIEQIGDLLFVHAGISPQLHAMELSVPKINHVARAYYDREESARISTDTLVNILYHPKLSPFWYRSYYLDQEIKIRVSAKKGLDTLFKTSQKSIDEILTRFGVSHIITGHTIVADTISTHYNYKVINTDTPHAKGNSEALLIEGTKFYRVNDKGQRWLLFDDAQKN